MISNILETSSLTFPRPERRLLNAHLELVDRGEQRAARAVRLPAVQRRDRRRPLLGAGRRGLGRRGGPPARPASRAGRRGRVRNRCAHDRRSRRRRHRPGGFDFLQLGRNRRTMKSPIVQPCSRSRSRVVRSLQRASREGTRLQRGSALGAEQAMPRCISDPRAAAESDNASSRSSSGPSGSTARFKFVIALATIGLIADLPGAPCPPGRYLSSWLAARGRWLAHAGGRPAKPDRSEIDADWRRKRLFDIEQSRGTLAGTFAEYPPAMQRLLRYAGLDPEHALVRWGNFDRTVLLPSTVFEADDIGPVVPVSAQRPLDLGPQLSGEGTGEGLFSRSRTRPSSPSSSRERAPRSSTDRPRRPTRGACAGPSPISRHAGAGSSWAIPTCRACSSAIKRRRSNA